MFIKTMLASNAKGGEEQLSKSALLVNISHTTRSYTNADTMNLTHETAFVLKKRFTITMMNVQALLATHESVYKTDYKYTAEKDCTEL